MTQPNSYMRVLIMSALVFVTMFAQATRSFDRPPVDYSKLEVKQLEKLATLGRVEALNELTERAEQGDLHAILIMVNQSRTFEQRRYWLTNAAMLNHGPSQYALYQLLVRANDVTLWSEGFVWLQRAANINIVEAQSELGAFYLTGGQKQYGIPKDIDKALFWLERAAAADNIRAHEILAGYLGFGKDGMPLDFDKSRQHYQWLIEWVNEHPEQFKYPDISTRDYQAGLQAVNKLEHQLYYASINERRAARLKLLNRTDTQSQTHDLALQLLIELAEEGDAQSRYELARIYAIGRFNVPADPELALYWYQQASELYHIDAMQELMNAYGSGGYGIVKDLLKARDIAVQLYDFQRLGLHGLEAVPHLIKQRKNQVEYYERYIEIAGGTYEPMEQLEQRALAGDIEAQYQFARQLLSFYRLDRGREAYRWMKRAADAGHADANFQLFRFYDGHGFALQIDERLTEDRKERLALYYLQRAVDLGHMEAVYMLANAYEKGKYDLPQDYREARRLYQRVVTAGKDEFEGIHTAANIIRMAHSRIKVCDRALRYKWAREKEYADASPLEKRIIEINNKYSKKIADEYNSICVNHPMCTTEYIRTENERIKNYYNAQREEEIEKVKLEFEQAR